ncbi:MAG: HEPN domain-containing protein [Bacteroidaceae bacterium]|nr:HEPN domain-containing protein [Bacteroidaceae bacterium]
MSLTPEERETIVAYRIEKAHTAITHAEGNARLGYWEVTANRLYYACYYAVSALLIQNGFHAQTHNGVIQLFGLHFVKTGKVSREHGKLYNQLFSLRLTGDYNDSYTLSEEDVLPLIIPAREMISFIEQLLQQG